MALRIFYVDDEPGLLELFEEVFESEGREILTFDRPEEAIKAHSETPADLIITDYRMPRINGFELAQRLPAALPMALITGDLEVAPEDVFDAVFKKPWDPTEIETFIKKFEHRSDT
jgi:two-component system, OmpR family, response regulator VicR